MLAIWDAFSAVSCEYWVHDRGAEFFWPTPTSSVFHGSMDFCLGADLTRGRISLFVLAFCSQYGKHTSHSKRLKSSSIQSQGIPQPYSRPQQKKHVFLRKKRSRSPFLKENTPCDDCIITGTCLFVWHWVSNSFPWTTHFCSMRTKNGQLAWRPE